MTTYHISSNGEPRVCKAKTPGSCPLGGVHNEDYQRVEAVAEALNEHPDHVTRDGVVFTSTDEKKASFVLDEGGKKHFYVGDEIYDDQQEAETVAISDILLYTHKNFRYRYAVGGGYPGGLKRKKRPLTDIVDADAYFDEAVGHANGKWFIRQEDEDVHSHTNSERISDLVDKHTYDHLESVYRTHIREEGGEYSEEARDDLGPTLAREELLRMEAEEKEARATHELFRLAVESRKAEMKKNLEDKLSIDWDAAEKTGGVELTLADDGGYISRLYEGESKGDEDAKKALLNYHRIKYAMEGGERLPVPARALGCKAPADLYGGDEQKAKKASMMRNDLKEFQTLVAGEIQAKNEASRIKDDREILRLEALVAFGKGNKEKEESIAEFLDKRD